MKRIAQKVKDIVEVRPFTTVDGSVSESPEVLAGYRFTDITADLMGKWLDALVGVRPSGGCALALAGFRGVGKSHFLSTFRAIAAESELRAGISDLHVRAVASQMSRRRYPVAVVRRGTRPTLIEEVQDAVGSLSDATQTAGSLNDLLLAASKLGTPDIPVVLLIDTAAERGTRVARDDGSVLAQIGETAKSLGMFVGLALDDDIAGADGANRAISGAYSIDYLDQEHLHRIVDAHIFSKKESALPVLHQIYGEFHESLKGFRWSEQRFNALYPLHPGILEIAPLIRLYIHDFAMLGFAAEAGVRILGRPAASLIGLDEVFDSAEARLRQTPDLKEVFATFDRLEIDVVGKSPVKSRLTAKLALKGLFMLSLDGNGATADELMAAMLLTDGGDDAVDVAGLLASFAAAAPGRVHRSEGSDARYRFEITAAEDHSNAVDAPVVSDADIEKILIQHAGERFSDVAVDEGTNSSGTTIEWSGSLRRGEIRWHPEQESAAANSRYDWVLELRFAGKDSSPSSSGPMTIYWELGSLADEDRKSLARLHALQQDQTPRRRQEDKISPEIQIQQLGLERIWKRVFITDAVLRAGEREYQFEEAAGSAHTLAQLFTGALAPIFADEFPEHPRFSRLLGVRDAGDLISRFFTPGLNSPETQQHAREFALPLGLAVEVEGNVIPASAEQVKELPVVRRIFEKADLSSPDRVFDLAALRAVMGAGPQGLTAEAQHVVLAALVAQRDLEFVASSGNRINHRSLDLQILWDDITGVAAPYAEAYPPERLLKWARLITGNERLNSLDRSEDRLTIIDALSAWLTNWRDARFLENFEALPDQDLNSSVWRIAQNTQKTFVEVAARIEDLIQNTISLDQCLSQLADIFSDSESGYERQKRELLVLNHHTSSAQKLRFVREYVSMSDPTTDRDVETARAKVLAMCSSPLLGRDPRMISELDAVWADFLDRYAAHYLANHAAVTDASGLDALTRVMQSDRWSAFETLAELPIVDKKYKTAANEVVRRSRAQFCDADVAMILMKQPFCTCSFSLERYDPRRNNLKRLEMLVEQGLESFASTLNEKGTGPNVPSDLNAEKLQKLSADELAAITAAVTSSGTGTRTAKKLTIDELKTLLPEDLEDWEIDELPVFAGNQ